MRGIVRYSSIKWSAVLQSYNPFCSYLEIYDLYNESGKILYLQWFAPVIVKPLA
ncbi:unnamed protein product [Callosobruchus maculatus]|uniref:Uncharacterized protein n=1 Tax=Callosobruchus maculatus TaxID=64391 RepID=A0A653CV08_CALMS|nr:unnamed protein product [Callosobruchus maculatus]